MIRSLSIRATRMTLPVLVQEASRGEEVIITVRDEPKARLGPLSSPSPNNSYAELIARGMILPPLINRYRWTEPLEIWPGMRAERLLDGLR